MYCNVLTVYCNNDQINVILINMFVHFNRNNSLTHITPVHQLMTCEVNFFFFFYLFNGAVANAGNIQCWALFVFLGRYRTQLWDKQAGSFLPSTPGLGMHVEIKDPDAKVAFLFSTNFI